MGKGSKITGQGFQNHFNNVYMRTMLLSRPGAVVGRERCP